MNGPPTPRVVHVKHGSGKNKTDHKHSKNTSSKYCVDGEVFSDSEPSVISSFLAIFSFSFFICLCLLHLAMCWNRLQQFESTLSLTGYGMEQLMAHYYGFNYRDPIDATSLRVNTSFYVH